MSIPPEKPELLAPAGTIQAGLTAIDAGADAIYAGLPRFNARERGQNCTTEEIAQLTAYAHRHGRKMYITLNTLIKESEIPDIGTMLVELMTIRPDAVIVQDLGVLRLIQTYFPELTVHASTQMGIHNSAGVRVAQDMGIRRVILERQVTYEEIEAIQSKTDVELEVFVHGALCCGQSGSCLFSSWMGGWSGNRGRCKQPCRRRYFSDDGNGFFFSPKDLYSLEDIPRLTAMGVSSIKIEGRMRRADYVRNVVEAYRLMLDTPATQQKAILSEAKRILSQALGRKWTTPFRGEKDFKETIQHQSLGTSGRLIGVVTKTQSNGFSAKLNTPLYLHDTIRIQPASGNEGPGIVVTRMTIDMQETRKVKAGQTCWIACDKPVESGSRVFKTGSQTADIQNRVDKLPIPGIAIDLDITLTDADISVTLPALNQKWHREVETQPARQNPLDATRLQTEFSKTCTDLFTTGTINVSISDDLFIPPSQLKVLRREFWDWCLESTSPEALRAAYNARLTDIALDALTPPEPIEPGQEETTLLLKPHKKDGQKKAIIAHPISDISPQTQEAVLPEFCAEPDLDQLITQVQKAYGSGIRRYRATSLYALDLLRDFKDITIAASYPLPICNSLAFRQLQQWGVSRATAWVELEAQSLTDLLSRLGDAGEVLTYARIPLLSTRMEIPVTGPIQDARGAKFTVVKHSRVTLILPEKVLAISPEANCHRYIDLTYAERGEKETSTFNYPRDFA